MDFRFLVISLGGTIALAVKDGRAVATEDAARFLKRVSLPEAKIDWSTQQFLSKDSVDITLGDLARLCLFIHSKSENFDGFIITTGTDSLEEVAYFLHEAFGNRLNIILTGAMRPPYSKDFDGTINFDFAATTCLSHSGKTKGVFLAMSGQVIAAINVVKNSSSRLDSFKPIYNNSFDRPPVADITHGRAEENLFSDVSAFDDINIPIITVSVGSKLNPGMFKDIDGCVLSCPGAFSLPEAMIPVLQNGAAHLPVVLASRCAHNEPIADDIYPGYLDRLESFGFLVRDYAGLSPQQSRLKLVFEILKSRSENGLPSEYVSV